MQQTLEDITRQDYALDGKLAEYVFFPLSHVFRESKAIPVRATEVALQCLQTLISRGWRESISRDLAKQLLILLTFLAGGNATGIQSQDVNEELATAAYACLRELFRVSDTAGLCSDGSVDAADFPVLGHAVSIVLNGVSDGPSVKVRLGALHALDILIASISDRQVLKNFFPGIVSILTKVLSNGSRAKGSYKILQGSLCTLDKTLLEVLNDDVSFHLEQSEFGENPVPAISNEQRHDEKNSWLEATSSQVKLALANVLALRYHEKEVVRKALFQLGMSVLQRCRKSLSQSITMVLETMVIICTQSSVVETIELLDNLRTVVANDSSLMEVLASSLHNWTVALPRVMQSNDDSQKLRILDQINAAFDILASQCTLPDSLIHDFTCNLRASVSAAIRTSTFYSIHEIPEVDQEINDLVRLHQTGSAPSVFPEVLFTRTSQRGTFQGLQSLATRIGNSSILTNLERGIMESLRTISKDEQLASLWLAIQIQSKRQVSGSNVESCFNTATKYSDQPRSILDDLYAFSLTLLSESTYSTESDWRLQALSLEVISLQAQEQQYDFRPELVDALYPILERMGSPNAALQRHAFTTLMLVSSACRYQTPKGIIIDNVDYLINAVGLKLSTVAIGPQVPQVLVMTIKFCGATIIPYLDDLVEAIFEILEHYHGYPKLVEQMFGVLNAIVEEGNKASATTIGQIEQLVPRVTNYTPSSISDLASKVREAQLEKLPLDPLPQESVDIDPSLSDGEHQNESPPRTKSEESDPFPKSLATIYSITSLTQHQLPTASPTLRLLLLNLLAPAFQLLSPYQDRFLPLVNALWPVLIARLYDAEAYITIAASNALGTLCRVTGNFLFTRFVDEWESICRLYERCEKEAEVERRTMGSAGILGRRWQALEYLVTSVVEWVGISGEMEDVIWDMIDRHKIGSQRLCVSRGKDTVDILKALNADAIWWTEEGDTLRNAGEGMEKPVVEGVVFKDITT